MGYPDMMRDIMEQTRRETIASRRRALENRSIVDRLTGLYSREYFNLRLDEEMARSRLYGNRLSLILVDTGLSLRDDQGKESRIGERTMQIIAGIIGKCLRDSVDLAFVYDTGKYAVIMPEKTRDEAFITADNIQATILREKLPGVIPHTGIAQYKNHEHIDELIQAADEVLQGNAR